MSLTEGTGSREAGRETGTDGRQTGGNRCLLKCPISRLKPLRCRFFGVYALPRRTGAAGRRAEMREGDRKNPPETVLHAGESDGKNKKKKNKNNY